MSKANLEVGQTVKIVVMGMEMPDVYTLTHVDLARRKCVLTSVDGREFSMDLADLRASQPRSPRDNIQLA